MVLKRIVADVAVKLLGIVVAVEEGAVSAAVEFLLKGYNGFAGADGAGQGRTVLTAIGVGWAVLFFFTTIMKFPAEHIHQLTATRAG